MTEDPKAVVPYPSANRHTSGPQRQARRWPRHLCVLLATLAAIVSSHPIAAARMKEVRRVLILNEGGIQYPAIALINDAIRESLQRSEYGIEIYREYMETNLFPDEADQKLIRDYYVRKYQQHRPDVIITVGSSPLKFMKEERHRHFAGIPVVFCEANGLEEDFKHEPGFTGVMMGIEAATTLRAALQLLPSTRHVFVVSGGVSAFDRQEVQKVKEQLEDYSSHVDITYVTGLAMPVLRKRLNSLPEASIVLLTSMGRDADGANYTSREVGPLISSAANAPVFSLFDVFIGHGEVGGNLSKLREQGTLGASAALKILDGLSPEDIPIAEAPNEFVFDWRALKRWGLKESDLPPGSIVLNRQLTLWEAYQGYVIGGISLILVEALLIFGLVWQRERRRRSERYSRELVLRSPVAMIVTRGPGHKNQIVNNKFTELFGYTIEDAPDEDHWWHLAYPDEAPREAIKAEWRRRVERALIERMDIAPLEASVRCKDGSYRHIELHFAAFEDSHLIKLVDLTDRHRAEIQLREGEERFRLVANTAPVMIWMSGTDKLCNYFNQRWLEFTGRPLEAELGNGWAEGVHPEDFSRCMDTYTQAFDRREPFQMEYRLRRHDGEYRWLSAIGVPRFNPDHSFAGYIGSCHRRYRAQACGRISCRRWAEAD